MAQAGVAIADDIPYEEAKEKVEEIERHAGLSGRAPDYAVLHIDLDRFKIINDTFGHAAGDSLLVHFGQKVSRIVGKRGLVARFGGDEFVILTEELLKHAELNVLGREILSVAATPFRYDGATCRYGASIGIAKRGSKADVLSDSDLALYAAKNAGRNCVRHFDVSMRHEADALRASDAEILNALRLGHFKCYYQPQFDAISRKISGLEALVRWDRPGCGVQPPGAFFPAVERAGLMSTLDARVLELVLEDRRNWAASGLVVPRVSVNVSGARLLDPSLLDALRSLELPARQISFELLETAFLDIKDELLVQTFAEIERLGIEIELDDFGTGHASILSFLTVAPSKLKIDRALIAPIVHSQSQRQIVQAIVEIGKMRDAKIIAEGIETLDHAERARDLGCDILQGYALAKPMPAHEISKLLAVSG